MMNQTQLQDLFKKDYNPTEWKKFLGEIFPNAYLLATPETLTDIDSHVASQALKLGYITLDENGIERQIAVYEVKLAQGIILERNRVGLRNLLRKYWKNIDAAFIVYHNSESKKWRFTYVSELTGYDAEGNFQKIQTEPKRYTYVLGEGESVRTATQRFYELAQKAHKATLDDVKEAFSVEKLSKAFFDEYKKHYETFCNYMVNQPGIKATLFNGNEKAIRDFCKKLLGRIVFLYFIQKKGWLKVPINGKWGEGDLNFLTNLFKQYPHPQFFYTNILTRLFFDTLNTQRPNDLIELIQGQPCRIPYLNGGLFEEDDKKHRNIIIDEKLFENLFTFFNQYSFTIYEDDPNDHTVAVDPEMLGHIFENLLEDNKDKGAFYTPKEIVHYMCQESLIEYLKNSLPLQGTGLVNSENWEQKVTQLIKYKNPTLLDLYEVQHINQALDNVKICDPAIGSGAFPMGLLQEIFTAKETLWYREHGNLNHFPASEVKLNIIQNSIYGVDIEKGAVDIARLRFWLSLVVDENEPKPLPNLDYKIVAGNSLVSKFEDETIEIDWEIKEGTQTNLFGNENVLKRQALLKQITAKQKEYFQATNKQQLATEIRNLKIDILINQLELIIKTKGLDQKPTETGKKAVAQTELWLQTQSWKNAISKLQKLKQNQQAPFEHFDWKLDFPEVLNPYLVNDNAGFDIVIGNPPYIQLQKDGGRLAKKYEKQGFETFERTGDIYSLFYEKGVQLLKYNGILTYITSNKWMRAGYGKSTRAFFCKHNPLKLIDLGSGIFESATVDTNILIIQKTAQKPQTYNLKALDLSKENNITSFNNYTDKWVTLTQLSADSWTIANDIEQRIKAKIERIGKPLKEWDINIYRGVLTGYNEAFIIDGKKKDELIAQDPKSAEIIKPILRGRDIKRYKAEFADLWLINTHNGVKEKNIPRIDVEKDYPAIYAHLKQFEHQLKKRQDKGDHWTNLRNCAYIQEFEKEKIVWNRIASEKTFSLVEKGIYISDSMHFFTGNNLTYLNSMLNSKLISWLLNLVIGIAAGGNAANSSNVKDLPIPQISETQQRPFVELVERILALKEQGKDTTALEQQIDHLVYKLYELTYEEVKVIDPAFRLSKEGYENIRLE